MCFKDIQDVQEVTVRAWPAMEESNWNSVGFLGEQRQEVDLDHIVLGVLYRSFEVWERVDSTFVFPPVEVI